MTNYRVSFVKDVLSSDGHVFKCIQQVIDIADAKNLDSAVETAQLKYRGLRGIRDWKLHADYLELEADGKKIDYPQKRNSRGKAPLADAALRLPPCQRPLLVTACSRL
jgi:hypothetical protein